MTSGNGTRGWFGVVSQDLVNIQGEPEWRVGSKDESGVWSPGGLSRASSD
jgi:hypothetical protein